MKSPSITKKSGSGSRSSNGRQLSGSRADRSNLASRIANADQELAVFTNAVRLAVKQHKWAGNPIAVWEDGQVKIIPPEAIPDTLED